MARYIEAERLAKVYMLKGKDKLRIATVINEIELAPTADVAPREEVAINALLELKRQIHDHAIYPHGAGINPYISLKLVDAIIQDALKHV